MALFDLIGWLLGLYTAYSAVTGTVFVKHRAWGRSVVRDEEPRYFWFVIATYGVLAVVVAVYF